MDDDNQTVFDTVINHLVKQGRRSINLDGSCAYRGMDGLMCAVGVLIPDMLYDPKIEGRSALHEDVLYALGFPSSRAWEGLDVVDLMSDLQILHDTRSSDPDLFFAGFDDKVARIATKYNLVNTNPRTGSV